MRTPTLLALLTAVIGCEPARAPVEPAAIAVVPAASSAAPAPRPAPLAVASAEPDQGGEPVAETTPLPGGDASIGMGAPGFALDDVVASGTKATLRMGNVTVVYFWATWCEPCKRAFPALEKLYKARRREGLAVIALSVDDEPEGVADFARKYGATFSIAWDAGHKVVEVYRVQTMPSTYVIDRKGSVRFQHAGFRAGDDAQLAEEVRSLL